MDFPADRNVSKLTNWSCIVQEAADKGDDVERVVGYLTDLQAEQLSDVQCGVHGTSESVSIASVCQAVHGTRFCNGHGVTHD